MRYTPTLLSAVLASAAMLGACAGDRAAAQEPPEHLRSWMDRLTVAHEYDADAGIIRAREVIGVPPPIESATPIADAASRADARGATLIVFATADRCAPCQQYKQDALNDPRVLRALGDGDWIALHVEVDRRSEEAQRWLGSLAIPMTYALRDGEIVYTLRGQRSADDLLDWLGRL